MKASEASPQTDEARVAYFDGDTPRRWADSSSASITKYSASGKAINLLHETWLGPLKMSGKGLIRAVLLALLVALPALSVAELEYPRKNIRIIVPYGPGGSTDIFVRSLQPALEQALGVNIIVRNISGGGGAVGLLRTLKAKPDGYTLTIPNNAIFTLQGLGNVDFKYSEFDYIAQVVIQPYILVVRKQDGWENLESFLDTAKQSPEKIRIGFAGVGSSTHVMAAWMTEELGLKATAVPFGGGSKAVTAAMGGHIDAVVLNPADVIPGIESGLLTPLVLSSDKRSALLPDVPTMQEKGYRMTTNQWRGIAGPKGLPEQVKVRWGEALRQALQNTAFLETTQLSGSEPALLVDDKLDAFVDATAQQMISRAATLAQATDKPSGAANVYMSSTTFPRIVLLTMLMLLGVLLAKNIRPAIAALSAGSVPWPAITSKGSIAWLLVLIAALLYALLLERLGYVLSTFLFVFAALSTLTLLQTDDKARNRAKRILMMMLFSAAVAFGLFFFFSYGFNIILPQLGDAN